MLYINAPEGCQHGTLYVLTRLGGVPTRHTHKWDGLHTRHLLESTHTNTHKHKQTHSAARQSTVRAHAVAPPSSSEEGASTKDHDTHTRLGGSLSTTCPSFGWGGQVAKSGRGGGCASGGRLRFETGARATQRHLAPAAAVALQGRPARLAPAGGGPPPPAAVVCVSGPATHRPKRDPRGLRPVGQASRRGRQPGARRRRRFFQSGKAPSRGGQPPS